jgi:hypothetical protein
MAPRRLSVTHTIWMAMVTTKTRQLRRIEPNA